MFLLKKCPQRWKPFLIRPRLNLHPAYRRTGGRVDTVSPNLATILVRVPLNAARATWLARSSGGSLLPITDGPHRFC